MVMSVKQPSLDEHDVSGSCLNPGSRVQGTHAKGVVHGVLTQYISHCAGHPGLSKLSAALCTFVGTGTEAPGSSSLSSCCFPQLSNVFSVPQFSRPFSLPNDTRFRQTLGTAKMSFPLSLFDYVSNPLEHLSFPPSPGIIQGPVRDNNHPTHSTSILWHQGAEDVLNFIFDTSAEENLY